MKRKYAFLALFLAIAMLFCLAVGCSGNTASQTTTIASSTPASSSNATTSATTAAFQYLGSAPVVPEMTTLTWLATNSGSLDFDWESKEWIHEICKNANIELDIELIDKEAYQDTVLPRIAAGELPDVVQIPVNDANMIYAKSGKFYDMADLYDQYGRNMAKVFDKIPALRGQLTTPQGGMYFFPTLVPGKFVQQGVMVTMSYLQQLGEEIPTTMDGLRNVLIKIRDADMNGDGDKTDEVPLFIRSGKLKVLSGLFGIDLTSAYTADASGKLFYSYTSEQYREFLTFFKGLLDDKLMNEDFASANYDIQQNLFANNRIGFIVQFIGGLPGGMSKEFNPNWNMDTDDFLLQPILPPTGKTSDPYYIGRDTYGERFAINATSKNAVAAFCFMDYCMSDEAYLLRNFGHAYTIDKDGLIRYVDDPDGEKKGANFKGIPDNEGWMLAYNGRAFNEIMPKMEKATRYPTIVFSYLEENEITVCDKYETDLKPMLKK